MELARNESTASTRAAKSERISSGAWIVRYRVLRSCVAHYLCLVTMMCCAGANAAQTSPTTSSSTSPLGNPLQTTVLSAPPASAHLPPQTSLPADYFGQAQITRVPTPEFAPASLPAPPSPGSPSLRVAALPPQGPMLVARQPSQSPAIVESVPTPLPAVIDEVPLGPNSFANQPVVFYPSLANLIWHPPTLGCGQFGCQRLWGDYQYDPEGFTLAGLARAYFLDDQRLQWSGLEATFGAEAALNPRYVRRAGNWLMRADGIFFLNQPFDRNILVDGDRRSYAANFQTDPFQIWHLNLAFTRGDFTVALGKDRTPFGRYYFPIYSNSFFDAPFIRTEVIRWVETGLFVRYSPGPLNIEAAVTNGGFERDTNSSKAFVGRVGFDTPNWALGASAKIQDGIGSEEQKLNSSYYGFDGMVRWGRFELSSEAVWDKYGFREPFDPNNIFWGRSIYYRDVFNGTKDGALHGFGYYFNLAWTYGRTRIDLNYGEYYPQKIGDPLQDDVTSRLMMQTSVEVMHGVHWFLVLMGENDRAKEFWRRNQHGFVAYSGVQWLF